MYWIVILMILVFYMSFIIYVISLMYSLKLLMLSFLFLTFYFQHLKSEIIVAMLSAGTRGRVYQNILYESSYFFVICHEFGFCHLNINFATISHLLWKCPLINHPWEWEFKFLNLIYIQLPHHVKS